MNDMTHSGTVCPLYHEAAELIGRRWTGAIVRAMMDGHRPAVWLSDRYSAQQGHGLAQQTCLAHLACDVAYALEASDDPSLTGSSSG